MARCPGLEYEEGHAFFSYDYYYCKYCYKKLSESEVKHKCKPDYGYEYEKCPIYKDR